MLVRQALYLFVVTLLWLGKAHGHFETLGGDDVTIHAFDEEPLFVSLGSYCAPASLARSCGLRKAAFPFDWNISFDVGKLIEILHERFIHFLSDEYLVPFGDAALLNTRYHLEFVHDGEWDLDHYAHFMEILQSKYSRRIERFLKLNEYRGKVFFVRSAFIHSVVDRHRRYRVPENIEIPEEDALRLYEALGDLFPKLKFSLIIINNHEQENVLEEKKLHEDLIMIRAHPSYETPRMTEAYCHFFYKLINSVELK